MSAQNNKQPNFKKIMLFIPVYNCEKQIIRVINQFKAEYQQLFTEVVIIDNRSTDNSLEAAKQGLKRNIQRCKATLLQNAENYNLGGSIKIAFQYAIKNDYDYILTLHGDDQGNLEDAIPLIKSEEYLAHDMCIGARFHKNSKLEGYSKFRIFGNKSLNFLCSIITQRSIDDLIAGLNIYSVKYIKKAYPTFLSFPNNLTFDVHWLLYLILKNGNFAYFPLTWKEEDQQSNAKIFRQAFTILKLFLEFLINKKALFMNAAINPRSHMEYQSFEIYSNNPEVENDFKMTEKVISTQKHGEVL